MGVANLVHCTPDGEALIVRMARVSNPNNANDLSSAPRLLRYLLDHEHWSPFEMVSMAIEIHTERDIAAQIIRHRTFSFQEFSTRYARTSMALTPDFRRQDPVNRQSSHDDLPREVQELFRNRAGDLISQAYSLYFEMLEAGVAKETARRVLPLCTPTMLYMHGTLRSWIHYIQLRSKAGTQLEHRQIAESCRSIFATEFPVIAEVAFK